MTDPRDHRIAILERENIGLRRTKAQAEEALTKELRLSKRLRRDREWQVFCHALGGLLSDHTCNKGSDADFAKAAQNFTNAAMQVMCGESEPEVSPSVKAWRACTIDAQDAVLRRLMIAAAETGNPGYNAAIAVLREVAGE
jgi:hypothetical protein